MSSMKVLDKQVALILIALAIVPYEKVYKVSIGFAILNAHDLSLLYLLLVVFLTIIKRGCRKSGLALTFASVSVFLLYILLSPAIFGVAWGDVVIQTRKFFPFIVATVMLSAKFYGDSRIILNWIAYANGFSAFIAMLMHLFFPDAVSRMLADEDAIAIMVAGRMFWSSDGPSFFTVAALILSNKFSAKLYLLVTLVFLAILLTQSRTLAAAYLLFFLIGLLYYKRTFLPIVYVCTVFACAILVFFIVANENMKDLFFVRFFGGDDISAEYERAFLMNRVLSYEQYYDIFVNTFPFGQGLGRPFSITIFGDKVYTADISIISFLLPLGIFGVVLFFWYLRVVWGYFLSFKKVFPESRDPGVFLIMILTMLLLSLNQDVYSRNVFVVFLAYFAILHFRPTRYASYAVNSPQIKKMIDISLL